MSVRNPIVGVGGTEFHIDQVQAAMANTTLGNYFLRKLAHALYRPFQHDSLDALIVIQMRMHRGDCQVMVSVLNARQSFGQFTFMVVVNIG
jgi:hypothetical protein